MLNRDEKGRFPKGVSGNPTGRNVIARNVGLSDKDKHRNDKLRNKFGITLFEYNELHERQGGVCALCGKPETKMQSRGLGLSPTPDMLHVDHDHVTGRVRGLLCYRCNTGIGKLYDSPEFLRKAADYLEGRLDGR